MHKVTLRKGFTGPRRQRAGITVTPTEAYEGDLTKEQLEAIKDDPELVVGEVKAKEQQTHQMVDVQPTKKELLDQAEAEGLELEGINARSKVNEVKDAIDAARAKKTAETEEVEENESEEKGTETEEAKEQQTLTDPTTTTDETTGEDK